MMTLPQEYIGREQAFIKHTILKTYLERLFMIIGQSELTINYVDCFAGPWSDENEELRDTSIGISINQMKKCVATLKKEPFKRSIKFRALFIEKDKKAFARLAEFLEKHNDPDVSVACRQGDYTTHIPEIVSWSESHFTFFFVDPKGWKRIIGPSTLKPLLERPKTEFLINIMYDFVNRAANIAKHDADIEELLGRPIIYTGSESVPQRQMLLLSHYRAGVNDIFKGRTAFVPIERPGEKRVLYFLVYLTRHVKGIIVFKTEAEKMIVLQRETQAQVRLRKQINTRPTMDMFGESSAVHEVDFCEEQGVQRDAKEYLLTQLTTAPLLIDNECWARFLQETNLYPGDLQNAIKELYDSGLINNLDADISKRRTQFVKPDWPQKSERWALSATDTSIK